METISSFAQTLGVQEIIVRALQQITEQSVKSLAIEWLNTFTVSRITRSNRVAGYFSYKKQTVALHDELFVPERKTDLIETFLHEVAHLIQTAFVVANVSIKTYQRPHGLGWQLIMHRLGQKPERTHKYAYLIERIAVARDKRSYKYEYVCKDCGHSYKKNRILKHENSRYHTPCRNKPNCGHLTRIDRVKKAA